MPGKTRPATLETWLRRRSGSCKFVRNALEALRGPATREVRRRANARMLTLRGTNELRELRAPVSSSAYPCGLGARPRRPAHSRFKVTQHTDSPWSGGGTREAPRRTPKRGLRPFSRRTSWSYDPQPGVANGCNPKAAMCVRNVDVHVSCSSHVDAQFAASFIDPRAE